jgi:hypothetical protein
MAVAIVKQGERRKAARHAGDGAALSVITYRVWLPFASVLVRRLPKSRDRHRGSPRRRRLVPSQRVDRLTGPDGHHVSPAAARWHQEVLRRATASTRDVECLGRRPFRRGLHAARDAPGEAQYACLPPMRPSPNILLRATC